MGSETVTMEDFENALKDTRASVTEAMERDYEKIQGEIKQAAMSVNPIGFFAPGMLKPIRERKHDDTSDRSEEHTSELQSIMRLSYAVFCLNTHKIKQTNNRNKQT